MAKKICQHYRYLAIKTIRLQSILRLPKFLKDDLKTGNLKIIILVRDPRAIINSRFEASQTGPGGKWAGLKQFWKIQTVCDTYRNLLDEIENGDLDRESKQHIMFARYEDLMIQPKKSIDEIYDFLDLQTQDAIISKFTDKKSSGSTDSEVQDG